ncbi:MAG TPA: AmmeMemoRadiSam system protein A [Syntrophorhabdaceae bacterium]|nr:AmmeMemoRadiSam system protein A [Syntrophorhabdaceae bacterium]
MDLSQEEREQLKKLARESIEGILFGKDTVPVELTDNLKEKCGAFVTIKNRGSLRGCIGYIRGYLPLHETVKDMAVQAAFHDPRFSPVSKDEWADIDIEISVLTPMKKIEDINEIEVGIHGIYIEKGMHSGLLLPQVATEQKWDRTAFIEYTCFKAGLPKDAWKSKDIDIFIFSAEVF